MMSTRTLAAATLRTVSRMRWISGVLPHELGLLADLGLERHVLLEEPALGEAVAYDQEQPVRVHRLLDEVERSQPGALDRGLDRPVGGDDYHRQLRLVLVDVGEHLEPVHPRHLDVQEHQVHGVIADQVERAAAVFGQQHAVAFELEELLQGASDARLIVGDQDGLGHALVLNRRPDKNIAGFLCLNG
jgi:hypothetical protein